MLAESCRGMEIDKLYHGECNKWIRTSVLQGIAAGCTEELLHGGLAYPAVEEFTADLE